MEIQILPFQTVTGTYSAEIPPVLGFAFFSVGYQDRGVEMVRPSFNQIRSASWVNVALEILAVRRVPVGTSRGSVFKVVLPSFFDGISVLL
jgi:hypothetical protein